MAYTIAGPGDFEVRPEEVQLPSQQGTDKAVLLRRPDLISLMTGDGEIPDVLTGVIMQSINGGGQQTLEISKDNLPGIMKAMNAICAATFVQPKVWVKAEADDTHMPAAWLSMDDRAFVFAWALGGEYEQAKSFREQSNGRVESVSSHQSVSGAAKRKARPQS